MREGRRARPLSVCFAGLAMLCVRTTSLAAQDDVRELAERCAAGPLAGLAETCREGALALQAGHAAVGVVAAGGAQITGAASTLGRRFGGMPRLSLGLRGGVAFVGTPDVERGLTSGGGSSPAFATQLTLAAGLLDGFSLAPTVGGILSLDAFATASALFLPGARGFDGSVGAWGVGLSLGVLRESFTLPGVTVSLARRNVGEVRLGDRAAGDRLQVDLDPAVTSARALVGKDLLALGVLAGVGWGCHASAPVPHRSRPPPSRTGNARSSTAPSSSPGLAGAAHTRTRWWAA
jgi:hypothetical protein